MGPRSRFAGTRSARSFRRPRRIDGRWTRRSSRRGRRVGPGTGPGGPGTRSLVFIAGLMVVLALSLLGPADMGGALKRAAADWWSSGWRQLKEEGLRALPAMRTRLREDPELPLYFLGQGLPGAGFGRDGEGAGAAIDWERGARALVARVTEYDLDDPRSLLARHWAGGSGGSVDGEARSAPSPDPGVPWEAPSVAVPPPPVPTPRPLPSGPEPSLPRPLPPADPQPPDAALSEERKPEEDGEGETLAAADRGEGLGEEGDAADNPWMVAVRRSVPWGEGPLVGIYHSHTSEMYRTDDFAPSHPDEYHRFNTADTGIVRVGEALAERLRGYGIGVVHSRRIHDSPVHALAYRRSRETVQDMVARYPTLQVILDIHRDSPEGLTAVVAGRSVGQVMILVGTGEQGRALLNPTWEQNLALARELEAVMRQRFPGLHRRTWVRRDARFNQDLHPGMLLIEIGSYDTHLEEARAAARLLGDALAETLWRRRAGG